MPTHGGQVTDQISLRFELQKHGWADLYLKVDSRSLVLDSISYGTEALPDLARAALNIATGGSRAIVRFDSEPAEWRLVFTRNPLAPGRTSLDIKILRLPDISRELPDKAGYSVLETQCDPDEFARAVLECVQGVKEKYGADGYRQRWKGGLGSECFPTEALTALETVVSMRE